MAGGGGERPKILSLEDKEAWGKFNQILIKIEEILIQPKAAKNIRMFMKEELPQMLDEVVRRDGKMEK